MAELIGNTIINLTSVDSTNNYATQQLKNNQLKEGTVVVAKEQLNGRGQMKNSWESEFGKNILLSIVLSPKFLPIQFQFMLSKVVALGICKTVSQYTPDVKIKWPNDIYIGNKKVAGILIENSIMGNQIETSVVGIGLNVNQLTFRGNAPNPVSIGQLLNIEIDGQALLHELLESIDVWYLKLKYSNIDEIDSAYLSALYRLGELASYSDNEGGFSGIIKGVNPIGQLIIQKEQGEKAFYHFKEVEFL